MELTRGQNLFEALQRVCDFSALEPEMDEILRAVEKDNGIGEYPKETTTAYHQPIAGIED